MQLLIIVFVVIVILFAINLHAFIVSWWIDCELTTLMSYNHDNYCIALIFQHFFNLVASADRLGDYSYGRFHSDPFFP